MGWVVKAWRAEGLATLASQHARQAAQGMLEAAERDARRMRRTAQRECSRTQGDLQRLEDMGSELLQDVRDRRATGTGRGSGGPLVDGPPTPELRMRDLRPGRYRGRRSRLRESPLAELFRATE